MKASHGEERNVFHEDTDIVQLHSNRFH